MGTTAAAPDTPEILALLASYSFDPTTESELNSMLCSLGTDNRISSFREISEVLVELLVEEPDLVRPLRRTWRQWHDLSRKLYIKTVGLQGWARHERGEVEAYGVLTCLLEPVARPQLGQILNLKKLVLLGCMIAKPGSLIGPRIVVAAARQVRLAAKETDVRSPAAAGLPNGPFGNGYLVTLVNSTAEMAALPSLEPPVRRMVQAIQNLAVEVLRPQPLRRVTPKTAYLSEPIDSLPAVGKVIALSSDPESTIQGDIDQHVYFVEPDIDPGGELCEEGLQASGIHSRSWLLQTQSSVLWQRGRINPYEWPHLQTWLSGLPEQVNAGSLTIAQATVIALVAATGFEVSSILALRIGVSAELTWDGTFRRRIPQPDNAFQQNPDEREWFEGTPVAHVDLELPSPVKALLAAAKPRSAPARNSLGRALGFDLSSKEIRKPTLTQLRETMGEQLREHVSKRLDYRHLQTILRHETFELTQDLLLTYLIAGRPDQAPPISMYYTQVKVEDLMKIHRQVMAVIFGNS